MSTLTAALYLNLIDCGPSMIFSATIQPRVIRIDSANLETALTYFTARATVYA